MAKGKAPAAGKPKKGGEAPAAIDYDNDKI